MATMSISVVALTMSTAMSQPPMMLGAIDVMLRQLIVEIGDSGVGSRMERSTVRMHCLTAGVDIRMRCSMVRMQLAPTSHVLFELVICPIVWPMLRQGVLLRHQGDH